MVLEKILQSFNVFITVRQGQAIISTLYRGNLGEAKVRHIF